jgi:glycosyltransferase involved in cell wall biosynthesis
MTITVILCTYNRCQSLVQALESVAQQKFRQAVEWEVLVVDNNSSDQTRYVAERFCREHAARFRYVFEPQQGKSYALNTGIGEARGDLVAFMDDDVTVEPEWLDNLTSALVNGEWAGAGGRILLRWKAAPPRWLPFQGPYSLAGVLAGFDLGDVACELKEHVPVGTNMAFRKTMFEKYGGFRTDLGPTTNSLIRNEDLEFGHRLVLAGERLRYEPNAIVYHPISEERIRKRYFQTWYFDYGRANIREYGVAPEAKCYLGIPRYLFRNLATWIFKWALTRKPDVRFHHEIRIWQKIGEAVESRRQLNIQGRDSDGSKRLKPA